MKNQDSGIEKEVDMLGRVVLPKNFRKRLGLDTNSKVLISFDGESLHIKPTRRICDICKKHIEINSEFNICPSCIEKVKKI